MRKRTTRPGREALCQVCESFCSHVSRDDPGECKELFDRYRKGQLSDEEFAVSMSARYGRDWERLMADALGLEFRER